MRGAEKTLDVLGVGGNTLDHLCVVRGPVPPDAKSRLLRLERQPGGQVPTALVALRRWGLRTAYLGSFGDDEAGRISLESLRSEGVEVGIPLVRKGVRNQESIILVDAVTGQRTVLWNRPGELGLRVHELSRETVSSARLLLLDGYDSEVALEAASWARESGTLVMVDLDVPDSKTEELLRRTDLAVVSREFLERFADTRDLRTALRRIARLGPPVAAVTLGAGGSLALAEGHFLFVPALRERVVDSTGAGDVFHAGCAYGVLAGWTLAETLRFANAAAALACRRLGARAGIPSLEEAKSRAGLSLDSGAKGW
ncbi:MAG: ribokinase [Candidatus Binatia bacterium]|nr:MAG: ribokinase [Candidatus Binatia bacterium]